MDLAVIGSIVRSLLTSFGGALVAKGFIDSAQLDSAVGAVVVLFTLAWSIWQKRKAK